MLAGSRQALLLLVAALPAFADSLNADAKIARWPELAREGRGLGSPPPDRHPAQRMKLTSSQSLFRMLAEGILDPSYRKDRLMFEDRRKTQRHAVSGLARLLSLSGVAVGDCIVADISEGGARIVAEGIEIPNEFVLVFAEDVEGGRECRVVWRLGNEAGVEFTEDDKDGFVLRVLGQ